MTDYISRCAELRPLVTRTQLKEIFPTDRWDEHKFGGKFGVQFYFGPSALTAPDGISREDIAEKVSFEAPFPATTSLYGFAIGMTQAEAEIEMARLRLTALEPPGPENRFSSGRLPDGFEVTLRFRKDVLEQLTIAQANHSEISETRAQFRRKQMEEEDRRRELADSWKKITDDDDTMLLTWAKHCKPWEDYEPSEFVRYAEWLRKADPDQRHAAALNWNWDYGLAPLLWISRRPDCDLATALHIFFGGEPEYYLTVCGDRALVAEGHGNLMTFDMMMDIKDRIERGFYRRSAIAFDLRQSFEILERYKPTAEQLAAMIPANLPRRREGRVIAHHNRYDGVDLPAFRIN
jgi:hypothetical protein